MTRFEKIKSGDPKTVGMMLEQYTAALMNGTAPVDVRAWLEQETDNETNPYLLKEHEGIFSQAESKISKLFSLLYDPLIIPDSNSTNTLRPVKGTTRKEVYEKLLKAQFVLGISERWYPEQWRGTQEADNGQR